LPLYNLICGNDVDIDQIRANQFPVSIKRLEAGDQALIF
jgi:hypothetical protein